MGKNGTTLMALFFIVIMLLYSYQVSTAYCIKQERESLLRLKASFISTFDRLATWKGTDCCNWEGVGCDHTNGNHVVKLDLRNYDYFSAYSLVSNGVDSSLFELKHLNYLDLSGNFFNYTQTPIYFSELFELTYLNLSLTSFHGTVPRSLGNLTKLAVLDFNNNGNLYPGELCIDDLGWVSSLLSLEYLDLSGVRVVQGNLGLDLMQVLNTLPSSLLSLKLSYCDLQNTHHVYAPPSSLFLSKLQHLDLSANRLDGPIPSILQNMTSLRYLNLNDNRYNSSIPSWLSNIKNLDTLYLRSNLLSSIEGGLSSMVGNNCHLKSLDLSFNHFLGEDVFGSYENLSASCKKYDLERLDAERMIKFGVHTIPSWLGELKNLKSLHLQNNLLYGSIPSSFRKLSSLQDLDISYNMINGRIPSCLGELKNLRFLYLQNNSLHGPVPSSFGNLSSLEYLDISYNMLNGRIPSWLGELQNLQSLNLQESSLFGAIPSSFGNLSSLERLDISYNMLNGRIPSCLGELKNLKFLYLENNSLHGPVPSSFGNLSSLEYLDISYNMLNGGIPNSFGKLLQLLWLNLRENNLDGVITESLGQLQNLQEFDFPKNSLRGVVTEIHFANLSQLKSVIMSGNDLLSFEIKHDWIPPFQLQYFIVRSTKGFGSDGFPRWLLTQKELSYLDLSNNNISGPIPTWLRFPNLFFLDISNNLISGPLPKSIGYQIPNVFVLYASNMHINGSLPRSICKWRGLSFLGLSNNELSGTIPSCLLTPNLAIFDLSSNKFSGVFPSSLKNLSRLEVMHLANNKLEGEPLIAMRSCESLFILDLEGNQFSGSIPSWMGTSLQSLQVLNLRGNAFNGIIPSSLWLLPYLQIVILADNKLDGNIPPNVGNFSATKSDQFTESGLACDSSDDPNRICYVSYVRQVMKSSNRNYSYSQLYSMVNIDLSNNNLYGYIPSKIATIKGLFNLNLSHNHLSGIILVEIGRLVALESLDLSFNQLSGSIPNSMSNLNSLGALNLSNNNFSGRIPPSRRSSFNLQ